MLVHFFLAGNQMQLLSFGLPNKIVQEIKGTPTSFNPLAKDKLIWAFYKDDSFFFLWEVCHIAKGLILLNLKFFNGA